MLLFCFLVVFMAPSDKVAKRKAHYPIEDDLLSLLADVEFGLSSPIKPLSALKRSKVDTTKGGG